MPVKVGIMSMQRIRNYGSSLQAYGLRRLIEEVADGVEVSFVDYRPGDSLISDQTPSTRVSIVHRVRSGITELNSVEAKPADKLRYIGHRRRYDSRYLPLIGVTKQPNYDCDVDVQVIGSDEVFNFTQTSPEVGYARDLFGHGSRAKRLVSYAASFGNTTLDRIESSGVQHEITEDLRRFSTISVRDENSAQIIEHLTGQRPSVHLDPVLVYDFMNLEPRVPSTRQYKERYLIVYGYPGRFTKVENSELRRYADSNGLTILCFGGIQSCCDRFVDCDPFELLAHFRDAEAVVTDTFHGAIMAIINDRPLGAVIRRSVGRAYGNEEKLGFMLDNLGLESNKVSSIGQIANILDRQIDSSVMGERLTRERRRTSEYLASIL